MPCLNLSPPYDDKQLTKILKGLFASYVYLYCVKHIYVRAILMVMTDESCDSFLVGTVHLKRRHELMMTANLAVEKDRTTTLLWFFV